MIYDARPWKNAQGNRLKGGGFEDTKHYRNSELYFCDIDNIHAVSKCFRAMYDIVGQPDTFNSSQSYQPTLENTGYMVMLSKVLKSVNMVVESMLVKNYNVLVHCSDGWDRTAQMCSLSQQLIDPYYRTIEGFIVLICKDWISFGHQFHLRFGHYDRDFKQEQRSPVFIQYLDCVRQLLIQFPTHFEYNHELLLYIAQEINSQKYGTFLGNNEAEREKWGVQHKTESMWTYVWLEKGRFTNKFYCPENTQNSI